VAHLQFTMSEGDLTTFAVDASVSVANNDYDDDDNDDIQIYCDTSKFN